MPTEIPRGWKSDNGPSDIERALMHLESDFPGATQIPIRRMSLLERLINRTREDPALASTSVLGGSININPNAIENADFGQLKDTLAHELTHVKQRKKLGLPKFIFEQKIRPFLSGYKDRPLEDEALDVESNREMNRLLNPSRSTDIELKPENKMPKGWSNGL